MGTQPPLSDAVVNYVLYNSGLLITGPKNRPLLILGSKKVQDIFFVATIAYLKENSKIKDKFFTKILTQKQEKLIFGLKNTRVNTVIINLE